MSPAPLQHGTNFFPVIALAASAGGVLALSEVFAGLPVDFAAAVLTVLHRSRASQLVAVLGRRSPLPIREAEDGELLVPGTILLAPPDRHLVVGSAGTLGLALSAPIYGLRPSADVLFQSLAVAFGSRVVAVVLTGPGSDGKDGVVAVKKAGGMVLAQDHDSSEFFDMPEAAVATGMVDRVLALRGDCDMLIELVGARATRPC